MRATSASQSTEISWAFLSKPDLLLENVTCLLILFSILFNCTLPLPIFYHTRTYFQNFTAFSILTITTTPKTQFQSSDNWWEERRRSSKAGLNFPVSISFLFMVLSWCSCFCVWNSVIYNMLSTSLFTYVRGMWCVCVGDEH